jgi:processive 1,2-diacylglycerol beta-glucosyltransferase
MRLLIISASAGAGHARAGSALHEAARLRFPEATIEHVDVLDFTGKAYKKAYAGSFLQMVNHAPALWGYLYETSDRRKESVVEQKLIRFFDKLEFAPFRRFVRGFAPDAVLATHFLPPQVFASSRKKGRDTFPLGVVVTDFDVHAYWVQPTADRIFVASDELKAMLAPRGIDPSRITVSGIPISQAFVQPYDRAALRQKLGLSGDAPVVLVMGGGAGVGAMGEAVQAVLAGPPVQALAIAGKNAELKEALSRMKVPAGSRLIPFGFVDTIAELMAVSDLAVTKSGGLTTSECLAMGLPMIVRDPIPGQEERTATSCSRRAPA